MPPDSLDLDFFQPFFSGFFILFGFFRNNIQHPIPITQHPPPNHKLRSSLVAVMASTDSPLHAVEMTDAPESSKGEILEATEYEWKLRTKRMNLAMKERTKRMKEEFKKWIPKKQFRHGSPINCCAFTPNGEYLVTGGNDGKAILWNFNQSIV